MAVHDRRAMLAREAAQIASGTRIEPRASAYGSNHHPGSRELRGPFAFLVETAHSHWNDIAQPASKFHDKPFGASGVQAEDHLQHARSRRYGCAAIHPRDL